jgi:hypothetical protein
MSGTKRQWLSIVAIFVLAPMLAIILIMALLLLGVDPHTVFLPGHFVRARFHLPNSVGVITTGIVWWAAIVVLWIVLRRLARR